MADVKLPHGEYDSPWVVALREEPGAVLCCDPDCDLSGGRAHVGLCESCTCGRFHAVEECPKNRTDGCRACNGRGYHTCLNCRGIGRIPVRATDKED